MLNLSHELQIRIRCCGLALDTDELLGNTSPSNTVTRIDRYSTLLAWLAGLSVEAAPCIAELIMARWATEVRLLSLREIRQGVLERSY
jgi:hypothetical protein